MSDTLYAVLVGGFIAVIPTLATAHFAHKQWKLNKKIDFLISERDRLEKRYPVIIDELSEMLSEDIAVPESMGRVFVELPEAAQNFLDEWHDDKGDNYRNNFHVVASVSMACSDHIKSIESEIKDLLS